MLSDSAENYIKAIQGLQQRHEQAPTKRIAEALSVTMPSVTSMLKRLVADGLVEHRPYKGVALTPRGHRIASDILRRHRLLELLLHRTLNVPWDEVHQYAEKMEHTIDERMAERIDAFLGFPTQDPHGSPIPQPAQKPALPKGVPLDQVDPGTHVRLLEVPDKDPEFLRYLSRLNLMIGTEVLVDQRVPYHDSLMLRLGDQRIPLGREMAALIRVEPCMPTRHLGKKSGGAA
jgi:DtxR family Mn-dependent transcriptional regulator